MQAYYANALTVSVTESYGQLRVASSKTHLPLPKVYVKVSVPARGGVPAPKQLVGFRRCRTSMTFQLCMMWWGGGGVGLLLQVYSRRSPSDPGQFYKVCAYVPVVVRVELLWLTCH